MASDRSSFADRFQTSLTVYGVGLCALLINNAEILERFEKGWRELIFYTAMLPVLVLFFAAWLRKNCGKATSQCSFRLHAICAAVACLRRWRWFRQMCRYFTWASVQAATELLALTSLAVATGTVAYCITDWDQLNGKKEESNQPLVVTQPASPDNTSEQGSHTPVTIVNAPSFKVEVNSSSAPTEPPVVAPSPIGSVPPIDTGRESSRDDSRKNQETQPPVARVYWVPMPIFYSAHAHDYHVPEGPFYQRTVRPHFP